MLCVCVRVCVGVGVRVPVVGCKRPRLSLRHMQNFNGTHTCNTDTHAQGELPKLTLSITGESCG